LHLFWFFLSTTHLYTSTAMSQLWLYEYMFQMWRIDHYALCIRTFNQIWNMYSYKRIWEIAVSILRFFCKMQRPEYTFLGDWRMLIPKIITILLEHLCSGFPGNWRCKYQNSHILQFFWINFEVFPGTWYQEWIELVKFILSTNFFWKVPSR
jgi:hypothetical protein